MKIGVVSIRPSLGDTRQMPFDTLYQAVGLNTGNYMFTTAVYRQLEGDVAHVGFHFDPDKVNEQFDAIVVPAANWINHKADWDWLTDLIDRLEIPVVTLGLGVQAEGRDPRDIEVTESSLRLARTLAAKGAYISTRGHFTTSFLQSQGIMNVVTTGCPSLYMRTNFSDSPWSSPEQDIAVQSTRYSLEGRFLASGDLNRRIFRFAGVNDVSMIYQSEREEMVLLNSPYTDWPEVAGAGSRLPELYGLPGQEEFFDYLQIRGRAFYDIDDWSAFLRQHAMVAGTRLHGAILALNSRVPAVLFGHDSRTSELIEFAGIPTAAAPDELTVQGLRSLATEDDLARYEATRDANSSVYRHFLTANGLKWKEDALL